MDKFIEYIRQTLNSTFLLKSQKEDLKYEMLDHLNLLKQDFLNKGYEEDIAINKAIELFGKSGEIKSDLRKVYLLNGKYNLFRLVAILIALIPITILTFTYLADVRIFNIFVELFGEKNAEKYLLYLMANTWWIHNFLYLISLFIFVVCFSKIYVPKPYRKLLISYTLISVIAYTGLSIFHVYHWIYNLISSVENGLFILLYEDYMSEIHNILVLIIMLFLTIFLTNRLYNRTKSIGISLIPVIVSSTLGLIWKFISIISYYVNINHVLEYPISLTGSITYIHYLLLIPINLIIICVFEITKQGNESKVKFSKNILLVSTLLVIIGCINVLDEAIQPSNQRDSQEIIAKIQSVKTYDIKFIGESENWNLKYEIQGNESIYMYKVIVQYKGNKEYENGKFKISLVNKLDKRPKYIFQHVPSKPKKIMVFSETGRKFMRNRIPMNKYDMPNFEIQWDNKSEHINLKYDDTVVF